eukprot:1261736-Karenia_brevis.AAC.1
MWKSVREELEAFYGLMPLLHSDWERRWSEQVTCYDASEFAAGVVDGFWPRDVVRSSAAISERRRFKLAGPVRARASALSMIGERWEQPEVLEDASILLG